MIVNRQVFNYRFTIGTLIVAIAILTAYGFTNYSSVKSTNDFIEHEKKLLQSELNEIINRYDALSLEKHSLKSQIESTKAEAKKAYDSLSVLKADVSLLKRYRTELMLLKKQTDKLLQDSLQDVIGDLVDEKEEMVLALKSQQKANDALEKENQKLEENLAKGALILANSFEAKVFRERLTGKKVETESASKADHVEVCFVIGENPLAQKGEKELYLQVLGPDNNVVADKGAVNFGEFSLIYSSKVIFDYDNRAEAICVDISNTEPFKKGIYYISVFENERKLGNTQIELY